MSSAPAGLFAQHEGRRASLHCDALFYASSNFLVLNGRTLHDNARLYLDSMAPLLAVLGVLAAQLERLGPKGLLSIWHTTSCFD